MGGMGGTCKHTADSLCAAEIIQYGKTTIPQ